MTEPAEILTKGAELHQRGRLDEALALYQRALSMDPSNAMALHLVGVVAHQKNMNAEAIKFIGRAIALQPGRPVFYSSLAAALEAGGDRSGAEVAARKALSLQPDHPKAQQQLVGLLRERRAFTEALAVVDRAISASPKSASLWLERGGMLRSRGKPGDLDASLQSIEIAVTLEPDVLRGQLELGVTLASLGRLAAAETAFRRAVALNPSNLEAAGRLGFLLQRMGRVSEAFGAFIHPVQLRHGSAWWGDQAISDRHLAGDPLARNTTIEKLRHDFNQLQWLEAGGLLPEDLASAVEVHRKVLEDVMASNPRSEQAIALSSRQVQALWPTYLRVLIQHAGDAVSGSPLNPQLDLVAIQQEWQKHKYPVLVIDNLLRPDALQSLLRFCRASTVWFDYQYRNGYLGARVQRGFVCPLLLQIAAQLTASLPAILEGHPLQQLWGYKYHQSPQGIGVHADAAAVNLNMWIAPDTANVNPETGGLLVYREPAPLDWDFRSYNRDQERMRSWLKAHQHTEMRVPHRQNRAVLFHSNLFHQTDALHFRPGYENRRINITMLYGDRLAVD